MWVCVQVCVFVQMNFPSVLVCVTMHICLCALHYMLTHTVVYVTVLSDKRLFEWFGGSLYACVFSHTGMCTQ